jgi:hypothetical protein
MSRMTCPSISDKAIQTMKWREKMMKQKIALRFWHIGPVLALTVAILIGCGGNQVIPTLEDQSTPTPLVQAVPTLAEQITPTPLDQVTPTPVDQAVTALAEEGSGEKTDTEVSLDASYPNALSVGGQLALGTFQLEGTENAVTPEQAAALLPLWQSLQGGVMAQAEVDAVLKQIEGTMTQEQLGAIAAMQLTQEDLRTWMQEQGLGTTPGEGMPPGGGMPPSGGTPPSGGMPPSGGAPSGGGMPPGEIPPEMATRMAEFQDMSEEEREAARATMQAEGGKPDRPGGVEGAEGRQFIILLNPLIELLEAHAGEA